MTLDVVVVVVGVITVIGDVLAAISVVTSGSLVSVVGVVELSCLVVRVEEEEGEVVDPAAGDEAVSMSQRYPVKPFGQSQV